MPAVSFDTNPTQTATKTHQGHGRGHPLRQLAHTHIWNTASKRLSRQSRSVDSRSLVDRLTESQLEDYREAFDSYDKDGGGTIDAEELDALMLSCGQDLSSEELKEMIAIADADGTGDINFAEFVTLMAHKMADSKSDDTLSSAFTVFDTEGTGFLTAEQVARVLVSIGEDVTIEEVRHAIQHFTIDRNGDDRINFDEFKQVIVDEKSLYRPENFAHTKGQAAVAKPKHDHNGLQVR